MATPGDEITISHVEVGSVPVGPAGAGVSWDFNYLTGTSASTYTCVDASGGAISGWYPDASIYWYQLIGTIYRGNVHRYDGSGLYYQGDMFNGLAVAIHSNDMLIHPLPLSFGTTSIDSFYEEGSQPYYGQVACTVDGAGNLTMPGAVYNNALRVHVVENAHTTSTSQPGVVDSLNYVIDHYYWYAPNVHYPVFIHSTGTVYNLSTGGVDTFSSGTMLEEFTLSTPESNTNILSGGVYPSPTDDQLTVEFALDKADQVRVSIFNLLGEEVHSEDMGNVNGSTSRLNVDVSSLDSGVYLARIETRLGASKALRFVKR